MTGTKMTGTKMTQPKKLFDPFAAAKNTNFTASKISETNTAVSLHRSSLSNPFAKKPVKVRAADQSQTIS